MTLLAIDAGDTGVTAVVVDGSGSVVATGHQALGRHSPQPGWVEHAPEEIWQATLGATREVLRLVDPGELRGLGITNQRDTTLLWDRDTLGSPRRAIGWQDRRTSDTCTRLRDAGHEERVTALTGLRLDPRLPGARLAWLAEHEPHTWALVESGRYAVGTVDSWLVTRMTRGTYHLTDVSNAARTLLLDLAEGDWSDELCSLLGVPHDALPELVPSWGEVATTDARSFLGLSLPVTGIAGELPSALVGQACFDAGDSTCAHGPDPAVLTNTGTTRERPDAGRLTTAAWRSPEGVLTYASETPLPATGAAVPWLRERVGTTPAGGALRVDGAADDAFCQDLADRAGVPVERSAVAGTSALGAALLAGLGAGVWSSTDDLRGTWRPDRRFDPAAGGGPART